MTISQVKVILDEIGGYSTVMLIPLTEVNSIFLLSNENIYPDDSTHVYFDSVHSLMKVYDGETVNGVFIPKSKPRVIMDLFNVEGFMLTSNYRRKSPYRLSMSM